MHMCCASQTLLAPQPILKLFDSLNRKLANLKFLRLKFTEVFPCFSYDDHENTNMQAWEFKNILGYEDKFIGYKGKAKVELNHTLISDIVPSFDQTIKDYIEGLKRDLPGFTYSTWVEETTVYGFKKSKNVTENFQVNLEIHLMKQLRWTRPIIAGE